MTIAIYTHAEIADFLYKLADRLACVDDFKFSVNIERLYGIAARKAKQAPRYIAYVDSKVRDALANPGQFFSESEIDQQINQW